MWLEAGQLRGELLRQFVARERSKRLVVGAAIEQLFLHHRPQRAVAAQKHYAAIGGFDFNFARNIPAAPALANRDVIEREMRPCKECNA